MTPDMVFTLEREVETRCAEGPRNDRAVHGIQLGSIPILRDVRVGGHWRTPSTGDNLEYLWRDSRDRPPVSCRRRAGPTHPTWPQYNHDPSAPANAR